MLINLWTWSGLRLNMLGRFRRNFTRMVSMTLVSLFFSFVYIENLQNWLATFGLYQTGEKPSTFWPKMATNNKYYLTKAGDDVFLEKNTTCESKIVGIRIMNIQRRVQTSLITQNECTRE